MQPRILFGGVDNPALNQKENREMSSQREMSGQRSAMKTDKHIGQRVRMRRMMLGITQESLGDKIGLTFQQVQKYEKGTNRIGAGRLLEIAGILDVEVGYFFDGAPDAPGKSKENRETAELTGLLGTRDGLALNRAFLKIDPTTRRKIVDLVEQIAA